MKLNREQQIKVEQNMPLVGKVIKDKIRDHMQLGIYSYDDIRQIGYIGLCKAVYSDSGEGSFSTYAYRLIWNEMCNALIKSNRIQKRETLVEPSTLKQRDHIHNPHIESKPDLTEVVFLIKHRSTESMRKGICALELSSEGYSSEEIGNMLNAQSGTIRMWKTRARRFLQSQTEIREVVG